MNNFPDIDSHYNLEDQKIDFFWQNGFVILKNVLSKEEISVYRNEIKKVAEDRNKNTAELFSELGLAKYGAMEAFKRYHF